MYVYIFLGQSYEGKAMGNQQSLSEHVIVNITNAERLSSMVDDLKNSETALTALTAPTALSLLQEWYEAARQAVHFCRLARLALPDDELGDLIDRVHALDEEGDLWDNYLLGEWFDEIGDLPEGYGRYLS
jgi:hypothetical protein